MKYSLVFVFTLACSSIQTAAYSQKLSIELHNKTGISLDSVQINGKFIGQLENDSTTILEGFKEFKISGAWPLMKIRAVDSSGARIQNLAECGTKALTVREGHYRFDIKLNNEGLGRNLFLIRSQ
jgi:hypothetical protein